MYQRYNGRRVTWQSKGEAVRAVLSCFVFVILLVVFWAEFPAIIVWSGLALFGGGGCVGLYRLLSPNDMFVVPDSQLGQEIKVAFDKEALEQIRYYEGGFLLTDNPDVAPKAYVWRDLEVAFGYKEDRYTTDEIRLSLFWKDRSVLTLSEDMPCWIDFVEELRKNVPDVSPDWYIDVAIPVFETKLTLLFDAQGRSQAEAERACYDTPINS
jgi:hypothetical protein